MEGLILKRERYPRATNFRPALGDVEETELLWLGPGHSGVVQGNRKSASIGFRLRDHRSQQSLQFIWHFPSQSTGDILHGAECLSVVVPVFTQDGDVNVRCSISRTNHLSACLPIRKYSEDLRKPMQISQRAAASYRSGKN